MENYIKEFCEYWNFQFDEIIRQYNSNIKIYYLVIDCIIDYKIKNNKDIIYKEDIPKILGLSQENFMENVIKDANHYNLDINNLEIKDCYYGHHLLYYHISTFLENEPIDIKIALKD